MPIHLDDETLLTQRTFRILLKAMSHPGKVFPLEKMPSKNGLMLILQTLLDGEVSFCLLSREKGFLEEKIKSFTGSKETIIEEADFIIIPSGNSQGLINRAKRGTLEYPDRGATAIYCVNSILPHSYIGLTETNGGFNLSLKGPGINGEITVFLSGISKDEFYHLRKINSDYPLGIDAIFVDSASNIMCIPRSTVIEVF